MSEGDEILEMIADLIVNIGQDGDIRGLIRKALAKGIPPYEIFTDGMVKGITAVGEKYERGEYFLTELVGAGEVVKDGMEEISPHLKQGEVKPVGSVVIGTVEGDLHDIGKNIVKMLLTSVGFTVHDLGVDVAPGKFVEVVRENKPDIVAMSALLTTTMDSMRTTVKELQKAGLRQTVKIIVGGAPINEEFGKEIGADSAALDAAQGVRICKAWVEDAPK
jgi:5-methyltetrahydrofolate--homocysteine methyltransferase